jgi:hypothetical protein
MRKGFIFFTAILFSKAYAGEMGNVVCHSKNAVPCEQSAWHFGTQALYLQPRYTGYNHFGALGNTPPGVNPTQLAFQPVNDSWGWGFKIEAAYNFLTGNDINLNWSRYNRTTNRGTINVPPGSSFTDVLSNEYNAGTISTLRRPTWDSVNAEFGQLLHFGDYNDFRFHGGVQYARIQTQVSLSEPDAIDSTIYSTQALTYSGFGPRMGMDMGYHLRPTFIVYADGAANILIGPNQFYDTGIGTGRNTWQLVTGSTTGIVPELELKLGAKYTYALTQGDLRFDLGWMWNNYFSSQVNSHGTDTHESDFGLQGLFLGLVWQTNRLA